MKPILLTIALAICSCVNKANTSTFIDHQKGIPITFHGYKAADLDTLYIRKFKPDGNFTQLVSVDTIIDNTIFVDSDSQVAHTKRNYHGALLEISDAYDKEVCISSINVTYQLHATSQYKQHTYNVKNSRDRHIIVKKNGQPILFSGGEWHDNLEIYYLSYL